MDQLLQFKFKKLVLYTTKVIINPRHGCRIACAMCLSVCLSDQMPYFSDTVRKYWLREQHGSRLVWRYSLIFLLLTTKQNLASFDYKKQCRQERTEKRATNTNFTRPTLVPRPCPQRGKRVWWHFLVVQLHAQLARDIT